MKGPFGSWGAGYEIGEQRGEGQELDPGRVPWEVLCGFRQQ